MKLRFLGGVGCVTGSMHVIDLGDEKVLVDCGLFQGRRAEANRRNRNFPFDPREITSAVVGHAHIDHSGNLPNLVKQGFGGTIYSTDATRDLCAFLHRDSAQIQAQDAEYLNKKKAKAGLPPIEPLYGDDDVDHALARFLSVSYHRPLQVSKSVRATFFDAGHILGAALTLLEIGRKGSGGNSKVRLGYIVDLGRKKLPILEDPEILPGLDAAIIESTYGDRLHGEFGDTEETLARVVRETHDRGGKVLIPAFALERTQEILYCLRRLLADGRIPEMPMFVDSPLATNVTHVFRMHTKYFDPETRAMLNRGEDPFRFPGLRFVRNRNESKALNSDPRPMVIIAASGMCEGGRILHHLAHQVEDPRNTILIVGFMAKHTLGRRIVEREPTLRIFDEVRPLRAQVVKLNAFSAHADRGDLLHYVSRTMGTCRRYFLVHGEDGPTESLRQGMEGFGVEVTVAEPGLEVEL